MLNLESNDRNEIFFVDGADQALSALYRDALTSASAHFIKTFKLKKEVDVYIAKRSEFAALVDNTRAYHLPPSFDRKHSVICVFLDPNSSLEEMVNVGIDADGEKFASTDLSEFMVMVMGLVVPEASPLHPLKT